MRLADADGGASVGPWTTVTELGERRALSLDGSGGKDLDLDRSILGGFFLAPGGAPGAVRVAAGLTRVRGSTAVGDGGG